MSALPRIQDFDDPAFDPFIADAAMFGDIADPYPAIAELRRRGSVIKGGYRELLNQPADLTMGHLQHYCVLGYDEVALVLTDPARFSNQGYAFNLGITFGRSISTMDAPEHPRYRRIFQKAFLPNIVSKWGESLVDPVIAQLMEQFSARGKADLVQEFTLHYPFHIIYRQLGLPPAITRMARRRAVSWARTSKPCWMSVAPSKVATISSRCLRKRKSTASACRRKS
jgi:cytochrome P450